MLLVDLSCSAAVRVVASCSLAYEKLRDGQRESERKWEKASKTERKRERNKLRLRGEQS